MDNKIYEKAVELRHELHMHPELSCQEVWTKQHLMDFLKENTSLEIVDKGPYFYAAYKGDGDKPAIGFRADFDALPIEDGIDKPWKSQIPGLGHKCGHDGHSASLAAFAMQLEKDKPERDVYLIFQHAEETGAGAAQCGDFVPETGIKEIYAYHNELGPDNTIRVVRGVSNCASMGMTIEMKGTPTHASLPEFGISPLYALCDLAKAMPELAAQYKYKDLVLATIVQLECGDHAFGCAPADGRLRVTLRAAIGDEMNLLRDRIIEFSGKLAESYNLSVSYDYEDVFPDTTNHSESVDKVIAAAAKCGINCIEKDFGARGSEDFGWFLKQTSGAMFNIYTGDDTPSIHTTPYDFVDETIKKAVDMFMALVEL